jgi:hypothetical protein
MIAFDLQNHATSRPSTFCYRVFNTPHERIPRKPLKNDKDP